MKTYLYFQSFQNITFRCLSARHNALRLALCGLLIVSDLVTAAPDQTSGNTVDSVHQADSASASNFMSDSVAEFNTTKRNVLIKNANVISLVGKAPKVKPLSVLIEDGMIKRVARKIPVKALDDHVVIDGTGKYLLPGLVDVHVHIWDAPELMANLAYGITTIRNASGMPYHLRFAEQIENGELIGPRLLTTGPILNGNGPNAQPNHQIVNNAEEAVRAVQYQYDMGYRHLKVYSNLSRESYEAILKHAKKLGMTLMGHTPEGIRDEGIPLKKPFKIAFIELLEDSFVSIEHMESVVWHALYDDFDLAKTRKLAKQIAQSHTAVTPTLIAHHNLVMTSNTQGAYLKRDGVEYLNPFIAGFETEMFAYWSQQPKGTRENFDKFYQRATKIFAEEGVVLLAGSDSGIFTNIPGQSLLDEFQLMSEAGLTPFEILQTATVNPAKVLGYADQIGRIKKGYVADLILLEENPLLSIEHLQKIDGIFASGRWFDANDIKKLKQQAKHISYHRTETQVMDGIKSQSF
ncbi:Adenine deaminase [Thalassocella blandensis]|nr:Adenine deaminase [Thalassocella blandensis]